MALPKKDTDKEILDKYASLVKDVGTKTNEIKDYVKYSSSTFGALVSPGSGSTSTKSYRLIHFQKGLVLLISTEDESFVLFGRGEQSSDIDLYQVPMFTEIEVQDITDIGKETIVIKEGNPYHLLKLTMKVKVFYKHTPFYNNKNASPREYTDVVCTFYMLPLASIHALNGKVLKPYITSNKNDPSLQTYTKLMQQETDPTKPIDITIVKSILTKDSIFLTFRTIPLGGNLMMLMSPEDESYILYGKQTQGNLEYLPVFSIIEIVDINTALRERVDEYDILKIKFTAKTYNRGISTETSLSFYVFPMALFDIVKEGWFSRTTTATAEGFRSATSATAEGFRRATSATAEGFRSATSATAEGFRSATSATAEGFRRAMGATADFFTRKGPKVSPPPPPPPPPPQDSEPVPQQPASASNGATSKISINAKPSKPLDLYTLFEFNSPEDKDSALNNSDDYVKKVRTSWKKILLKYHPDRAYNNCKNYIKNTIDFTIDSKKREKLSDKEIEEIIQTHVNEIYKCLANIYEMFFNNNTIYSSNLRKYYSDNSFDIDKTIEYINKINPNLYTEFVKIKKDSDLLNGEYYPIFITLKNRDANACIPPPTSTGGNMKHSHDMNFNYKGKIYKGKQSSKGIYIIVDGKRKYIDPIKKNKKVNINKTEK